MSIQVLGHSGLLPIAAIGGVALIGYLGYRLVQLIANSEVLKKISLCFQKCCGWISGNQESHTKEGALVSKPGEAEVETQVEAFFQTVWGTGEGDKADKLIRYTITFRDQVPAVQNAVLATILEAAFTAPDEGYHKVLDQYLTPAALGMGRAEQLMEEFNKALPSSCDVRTLREAFETRTLGTLFSKFD